MIRKLVLVAIATGLLTPLCAQAAISENVIKETIVKNSIEMNVDPALALSIAKKESGFRHELKSHRGAVGVFQLLPSTARRMGYDPYSLNDNIRAGLAYYKMMYKMFGSTELALAAYNAGPGNVKKYGGTVPPYSETKRFVNIIMRDYHNQIANPDPIIAKCKVVKLTPVKLTPAMATDLKTELNSTGKKPTSNDSMEVPEVKDTDAVMEVL